MRCQSDFKQDFAQRTFRVIYLILLAVFFALDNSPADYRANAPPPPMPKDVVVRVIRGETVEISLQALGRSANSARFLQRTQPAAGQLSAIRPDGPGRAIVTYQHDPASSLAEDGFLYAVQGPDSPVSAPGRVRIMIVEKPPRFVAPREIPFPETVCGRQEKRTVILKNTGGGVIYGTASVAPPWHLLSGERYHLAEGGEHRMELIFSPERPGAHADRLFFSHDPSFQTHLTGSGIPPFRIESDTEASLHHTSSGESPQTHDLVIVNHLEEEIDLEVTLPSFLETVETPVRLPPLGQTGLQLRSAAEALEGGEGLVELESGPFRVPFRVRVFRAPAVISIQPENGIDFGSLENHQTASATLEISNTGGSPVEIQIHSPPSISLGELNRFTLDGGDQKTLTLRFEPNRAGLWEDFLQLAWSQERLSIPLRANVAGEKLGEARFARPPALPPTPPGETLLEGSSLSDYRTIPVSFDRLLVLAQTARSARVAWEGPAETQYRVDYRKLDAGEDGRVRQLWLPMPNVFLTRGDDNFWIADLQGLPPGSRWVIRIMELDLSGNVVAVSNAFTITTTTPQKTWRPSWLLLVLPVLLALVVWIRRQRNRGSDRSR